MRGLRRRFLGGSSYKEVGYRERRGGRALQKGGEKTMMFLKFDLRYFISTYIVLYEMETFIL